MSTFNFYIQTFNVFFNVFSVYLLYFCPCKYLKTLPYSYTFSNGFKKQYVNVKTCSRDHFRSVSMQTNLIIDRYN